MKKLLFAFITASVIGCTNAQTQEFSAQTLSEKLVAPNGSTVAFSSVLNKHKGKTVVIEVWASWCGDCIKAMPKLKALQQAHPEVDYVFISMDKVQEKWTAGIEKHELTGDHYWATDGMKGSFGKSIDLDWIPRYIIVDKKGKIATYRAVETDFDKIDKTLNDLKSK